MGRSTYVRSIYLKFMLNVFPSLIKYKSERTLHIMYDIFFV